MKNHIYEFDGEIRHQSEGGPIGLELTGNVAQVFMIWWDRRLMLRLGELQIQTRLYKRYVDDGNMALEELLPGTRYVNGVLSIDDACVESDGLVESDKRTMLVVKEIGNSIHPSIQLEIDYPSNHPDKKMPSLDLKVWIETRDGETKIIQKYYDKDVSYMRNRPSPGNRRGRY